MVSLPGFGSGRPSVPLVRTSGQQLDQRLERGGEILVAGLREEVNLAAVCWVFNESIGEWRLWIVLPEVETEGAGRLIDKTDVIIDHLNGSTNIELFDVDIISPSDPEFTSMVLTTGTMGEFGKFWASGNSLSGGGNKITAGNAVFLYLDTAKIFADDALAIREKQQANNT